MGNTNDGGGFKGYEKDPSHSSHLAHIIGGFLVNFSGLELAAEVWLRALTTDEVAALALKNLPLRQKIQVIYSLLDAERIPPPHCNEVKEIWQQVDKLREIRNQVAHNPVLFGWHGQERDAPPDFAGVLDHRKGSKANKPQPGLISSQDIASSQDQAANLAQKLYELAEKLESIGLLPLTTRE